jgi:hypothetical protein
LGLVFAAVWPASGAAAAAASPVAAFLPAADATRHQPIFPAPENRRPRTIVSEAEPVRPLPTIKPDETDRPRLVLIGTVANTKTGIALFFNPATKAEIRLRIGETHDGWMLHSVGGRDVTLQKDSAIAVLILPFLRNTSQADKTDHAVTAKADVRKGLILGVAPVVVSAGGRLPPIASGPATMHPAGQHPALWAGPTLKPVARP